MMIYCWSFRRIETKHCGSFLWFEIKYLF